MYTREQLEQLSTEDLQKLQGQLMAEQDKAMQTSQAGQPAQPNNNIVSGILPRVKSGALAGLRYLSGMGEGTAQPAANKGFDLSGYLQKEQLKDLTDPTRRLANMRLQQEQEKQNRIDRARAEQTDNNIAPGGQQTQSIQTDQQTPQPQEQVNMPPVTTEQENYIPPKITIGTGEIDYDTGLEKKITIDNPAFTESQAEKKLQRTLIQKREEARVKNLAKQQENERKAVQDFGVIAGGAQRLVDKWVKGYEEGGIGNAARQMASNLALKAGGGFGDRFKDTGAFPGAKGEMALKMMPLLTGSVRIVQSVFNWLTDSLPAGNDGPETAQAKITQSVENMYGFYKAVKESGKTPQEINNMTPEEAENFGNEMISLVGTFEFTPQEQIELNKILEKVNKPFQKVIRNEPMGQQQIGTKQGGQTMIDAQGNKAIVYPDGTIEEIQ